MLSKQLYKSRTLTLSQPKGKIVGVKGLDQNGTPVSQINSNIETTNKVNPKII